jgi:hypothetical protein
VPSAGIKLPARPFFHGLYQPRHSRDRSMRPYARPFKGRNRDETAQHSWSICNVGGRIGLVRPIRNRAVINVARHDRQSLPQLHVGNGAARTRNRLCCDLAEMAAEIPRLAVPPGGWLGETPHFGPHTRTVGFSRAASRLPRRSCAPTDCHCSMWPWRAALQIKATSPRSSPGCAWCPRR